MRPIAVRARQFLGIAAKLGRSNLSRTTGLAGGVPRNRGRARARRCCRSGSAAEDNEHSGMEVGRLQPPSLRIGRLRLARCRSPPRFERWHSRRTKWRTEPGSGVAVHHLLAVGYGCRIRGMATSDTKHLNVALQRPRLKASRRGRSAQCERLSATTEVVYEEPSLISVLTGAALKFPSPI